MRAGCTRAAGAGEGLGLRAVAFSAVWRCSAHDLGDRTVLSVKYSVLDCIGESESHSDSNTKWGGPGPYKMVRLLGLGGRDVNGQALWVAHPMLDEGPSLERHARLSGARLWIFGAGAPSEASIDYMWLGTPWSSLAPHGSDLLPS